MGIGEWPFYVSYSWETEKQEPIVAKLEKDLGNFPNLKLTLDKEQCKPGDSIKAFLNKVGKAPRLVLVLSEKYFDSEYTLREFAIALTHGGLNTRVRVVLVDGFRLDHFLKKQLSLQNKLNEFGIKLNLLDYEAEVELLSDSLVSIPSAKGDTDLSLVLQHIQESYQRYPNPELDDAEKLIKLRSVEQRYLNQNIEELFEYCEELAPLAKTIKFKAAEAKMYGKISDFLCPLETGNAQQRACEEILFEALSKTLNELKSRNRISNLFLDKCDELVGWVATSFVNDLWIQKNGASISDYYSPSNITIRLKNGQLIELFIARAHRRNAGFKQSGKAAINYGGGLLIKNPASVGSSLEFIFQELMTRFIPDKECSDMNDLHWEELDQIIRMKRRMENIYIIFSSSEQCKQMKADLTSKLPCLPQFWLESGTDSSLLLVSEPKVNGILKILINLIEDNRKYAKRIQPETV